MLVLMLEVTLLVALAMRHLWVVMEFSLGDSKRDTFGDGEVAMAMEP